MKNKLFLVAALVILTSMPFYGQHFSVGVTAGLNVTTLSEPGNLYDNDGLKTGFGGGLALRYAITDGFGLQSGVLFEQKGFKKSIDVITGQQNITGKYDYITVPLMAEGSLPLCGKTRLYGLTGFYAGFKAYTDNSTDSEANDTPVSVKDNDINNFDGGWTFGGGVNVPLSSHLLQIGFRYSMGFSEVVTTSPDDRNKSVLFGATLFF